MLLVLRMNLLFLFLPNLKIPFTMIKDHLCLFYQILQINKKSKFTIIGSSNLFTSSFHWGDKSPLINSDTQYHDDVDDFNHPELSYSNQTNEPINSPKQESQPKLKNIITSNETTTGSGRQIKPPSKYQDFISYAYAFSIETSEPQSVAEALSDPDTHKWKQAMDSEYDSV